MSNEEKNDAVDGENVQLVYTTKKEWLEKITKQIEDLTTINQSLEVELGLMKTVRENLSGKMFSEGLTEDEQKKLLSQEQLINIRHKEMLSQKAEVEQKLKLLTETFNSQNEEVESLGKMLSALQSEESEKVRAYRSAEEYKNEVFARATTKRLPYEKNLFETSLEGLLSFWDKQMVGSAGSWCVFRSADVEEISEIDISTLGALVHNGSIYKAIKTPLDLDKNAEISPKELLTEDYYKKVQRGEGFDFVPREKFLVNLSMLFSGLENVGDVQKSEQVETMKKLLNKFPKAVQFLPNSLFDRVNLVSLIQNELMISLAKLKSEKINKTVTVEAQDRYAKEVFELFNAKLREAKVERFRRKSLTY